MRARVLPRGALVRRASSSSVDASELAKFPSSAAAWWDPASTTSGTGPLHALHPTRVKYLAERFVAHHRAATGADAAAAGAAPLLAGAPAGAPLAGARVLDVGCGGGLLAESLARLGARVTATDASAATLAAARAHGSVDPVVRERVEYRVSTVEQLAAEAARGGDAHRFDAVCALEVVEHVRDARAFVGACGALVRPRGALFVSTLNRTAASWALAIVAAERVARLLPSGTHDWSRFVTPDELREYVRDACADAPGLRVADVRGIRFIPGVPPVLPPRVDLVEDTAVNYILHAIRDVGVDSP